MRQQQIRRMILALLVAPAVPSVAGAQLRCDAPTTIARTTGVYRQPPRFTSGKGWILERPVDTLRVGGSVRICARRRIGFVVGAQQWLEIQYARNGQRAIGWIPQERASRATLRAGLTSLVLPRLAHAQEPSDTGVFESAPPPNYGPYVLMFVAMLFGMAAKGLYDSLDQEAFSLRRYMRTTVRAFVVAPIVFAAISSAANFEIVSVAALFTYAGFSFQNGFFWQTLLAKQGGTST